MKVILHEKIYNLGDIGDVVTVKSGYARNYLIPKEKVAFATEDNINQFNQRKEQLHKKQAELELKLAKITGQMEDLTIDFHLKSASDGRLYGSVTSSMVARSLNNLFNEIDLGITKGNVVIPQKSIKELGEHKVQVVFNSDKNISITVRVLAEADTTQAQTQKEIDSPDNPEQVTAATETSSQQTTENL